ncbi:MAG: pentapeptide repeat-containing protein [Phormidesmis sp.]
MNLKALLEESIEQWNQWRSQHPEEPCNLEGYDLSNGYFYEGDFSGADLRGANLRRACLIGADMRWADLRGADLSGAYLEEANLYGASLDNANLTGASLERADLRRARGLSLQSDERDSAQDSESASVAIATVSQNSI